MTRCNLNLNYIQSYSTPKRVECLNYFNDVSLSSSICCSISNRAIDCKRNVLWSVPSRKINVCSHIELWLNDGETTNNVRHFNISAALRTLHLHEKVMLAYLMSLNRFCSSRYLNERAYPKHLIRITPLCK